MAEDRASMRKPAVIERRPAVVSRTHPVAAVVHPPPVARTLQQRLGNQGTQVFAARVAARSSAPGIASKSASGVQALSEGPAPLDLHRIVGSSSVPSLVRSDRIDIQHAATGGMSRTAVGADTVLVQRKAEACSCGGLCDECLQPALKKSGPVSATPPITPRRAVPTGGSPLDHGLASTVGERLGHSLTGVRIHDDAEGHRFAVQFGARAVTVGSDIFFAAGHYRPGTPRGDHDLVHELAHVVQQRNAPAAGDLGLAGGVSLDRYRALERAADAEADRVISGRPSPIAGERIDQPLAQAVGETATVDIDTQARLFYLYGVPPIARDPDAMDQIMARAARLDADWITDKILEIRVDDDDERSVLNELWKFARTPNHRGGNYLDVLLDAIRRFAYWFDYGVGESIKGNGVDKLFAEMEDDHASELRTLVDNYSVRYAKYRGRGDITRTSGAVTAFLPGDLKTRLSSLNQKLAGRTTVLATQEEIDTINTTYANLRAKTLGFVSIPPILLQPAGQRAALLALLIPVAAALAAAIAEALLLLLVVIVALALVWTITDILERLANRPQPRPEPAKPARPAEPAKPRPGDDVIPIESHPRYVPRFKPTEGPTPVSPPIPVPDPKADEDRRRRERCRIEPVAPLGGDELANIYCEFATGVWSGLDYRVTTPEGQYAVFDALAGGTLYECKCGYLGMVRTLKRGDRHDRRYWRALAAFEGPDGMDQRSRRQQFVASTCGLPLRWYVSNDEVRDFLTDRWHGLPIVLTVEWSECD
jgi:hypothetical protein